MGLVGRMNTIVKAKISRLLSRFEDPRETLDYSYEKQLELLNRVRRGVVDVAASKKRLEFQVTKLRENAQRLTEQAKQAIKMGREDLAKIALERKHQSMAEIASLETQIQGLQGEQEKLEAAEKRLNAKVETFRNRKEVIKAQYSAAEAQVKVTEAVTGISEEMEDVGLAAQRAEQKTEDMKARAAALDELVEKGTLADVTGAPKDEVERELQKLSISSEVEAELEALKKEAPP